jgi:hypothetical protein
LEGIFTLPLTPYHLGPASAVGIIFRKYFDIPTLLVSSVAIDVEPFTVIIFNLDYPLHGFLHNFMFGSLVAIAAAFVMYALGSRVRAIMALFHLEQKSPLKMILWSSFFGVYSHICLDSMLYDDMSPFYPSGANPLLGMAPLRTIQEFCLICFALALAAYFIKLLMDGRRNRKTEAFSRKSDV